MTITLQSANKAFLAAGWHLDHTSRKDGRVSSHYFVRFEGELPNRKQVRVRVSDHELGATVYGEAQGLGNDLDFVIPHFEEAATAEDLVTMSASKAARWAVADMPGGYAPSTHPEDWTEALEANS